MNFDGKKLSIEEYPAEYYEEFLEFVRSKYEGKYWHLLPKSLARFWKVAAPSVIPAKAGIQLGF
jgi:hypothetical protein